MTYEYVDGAEPVPAPPPPPPAAAASAAASAATSQHSNAAPSQSGHGPSPRSSAAHPPQQPPPLPLPVSALAPPLSPPSAPHYPPPPPPLPVSQPRQHVQHQPSRGLQQQQQSPHHVQQPSHVQQQQQQSPHHMQQPSHVLLQQQQQQPPPLLQPLQHPTAAVGFNDYFAGPAVAPRPPADSGGPVPVAPPPTHPRPSKEALFGDYFTTPAGGAASAAPPPRAATAAAAAVTPAMTPSSPSADNIPLPGANLPERGKSDHSSIHGPSAVVDEKKPSVQKRPSVWTQAQAPVRKDFKTPADYRPKPQKDANWPLVSSEPSSNNVKEEEEPTDNKDNKKDAKERSKEKAEALAEIKRKARERALKSKDAKEPGSIEDNSTENGRPIKERSIKCTVLVALGIVTVIVLLSIGIVFTLAATGGIRF